MKKIIALMLILVTLMGLAIPANAAECQHENTELIPAAVNVYPSADRTRCVQSGHFFVVCEACEAWLTTIRDKTVVGDHVFADGACAICFMEEPRIEDTDETGCPHQWELHPMAVNVYPSEDKTRCIASGTFLQQCILCEENGEYVYNHTAEKDHNMLNGECAVCHMAEVVPCNHQWGEEQPVATRFSSADNSYHEEYGTFRSICRLCDEQQLIYDKTVTASHTFNGDVCTVCGHKKPLERTGYVYRTGTDRLNVRSWYGTQYRVLAKAYAGEALTVIGDLTSNGWYKVKTQKGIEGYVYAYYLTFTKPAASTPAVSAPAKPATPSNSGSAVNNSSSKAAFVKANLPAWTNALNAYEQSAQAVAAAIADINFRNAAQKLLGCSFAAAITMNPAKLMSAVANEESVIGVYSLAISDSYYRYAASSHNQYRQLIKNGVTNQNAEAIFRAYRDALSYYAGLVQSHYSTVSQYAKKGEYTKRQLDTFVSAAAEASIPAAELVKLAKAAKITTTAASLLSAVETAWTGSKVRRDTASQWNAIWAKV